MYTNTDTTPNRRVVRDNPRQDRKRSQERKQFDHTRKLARQGKGVAITPVTEYRRDRDRTRKLNRSLKGM